MNGIPAAYTTATAQTQQGQVDVTVFAYQWDQNTAYHFVTLTRGGSGIGPFGLGRGIASATHCCAGC